MGFLKLFKPTKKNDDATRSSETHALHPILTELKQIAEENLRQYLPNVRTSDLEANGTLYYMNGDDGTVFDWYMNKRLCEFMAFYNDRANLGAIKLNVCQDGKVMIYLYADKGKTLCKETSVMLTASPEALFQLAVALYKQADEALKFDRAIEELNSDHPVTEEDMQSFRSMWEEAEEEP